MDSDQIRKYFYSILAKKDYSEQELYDKAVFKGGDQAQIKEVIEEFKQKKYIDDTRLYENIIEEYKDRKGFLWIKQKLQARKISSEVMVNFSNELIFENQNTNLIKTKLSKKYDIDDWKIVPTDKKQKILRYLVSKGYVNPVKIIQDWGQSEV